MDGGALHLLDHVFEGINSTCGMLQGTSGRYATQLHQGMWAGSFYPKASEGFPSPIVDGFGEEFQDSGFLDDVPNVPFQCS
jgi:hypothetical protein